MELNAAISASCYGKNAGDQLQSIYESTHVEALGGYNPLAAVLLLTACSADHNGRVLDEKNAPRLSTRSISNRKLFTQALASAGAFDIEEVEISSAPASSKMSFARSFWSPSAV